MSGILALASAAGGAQPDPVLRRMLAGLRQRGAEAVASWTGDGCALAVARHRWELQADFAGAAEVVSADELLCVADASLYYRPELLRALAAEGVLPTGNTPAHLILAAWRAWGTSCVERLEGDFAFALWDRRRRQLFCARDFAGKRPLYYAQLGSTLLVASTVAALLEHPDCSRELDLAAVAAAAAGLFAADHLTCYRAVSQLPAATSLFWRAGELQTLPHAFPPPIEAAAGPPFAAAAEELRALIGGAVRERLATTGPTSVWMSGGYDSTAVFALGELTLRQRGSDAHLRPISISYPPGDPGREDELIEQAAGHWGAPVHWLDIREIPLLDEPEQLAAERDEPFAHIFENWNRALAAGSRAVGARVALEGVGGDQLFQLSPVYLADLLREGRWYELAREWRGSGLRGTGVRNFVRWALYPHLPPALRGPASRLAGGRLRSGYLERELPPWIDRDFARTHRLLEREREHTPARAGRSHSAYETHWYLTHPFGARVISSVFAFGLEAGVEVRSPLYDRRVIEFAVRRPRSERATGRETKRLLRSAVKGLLPEAVLAPRRRRTGVTGGYLESSLRKRYSHLLHQVYEAPLLAKIGIVDGETLRRYFAQYLERGDENLAVSLLFTFHTELWLRARTTLLVPAPRGLGDSRSPDAGTAGSG